MAPPKQPCCNPSQKESHVKVKRQKGVQPISDKDRKRGIAMYPEFDWTSATHLCLLCRTDINKGIVYKKVQKLTKVHQSLKSKKRPLSSEDNSGDDEQEAPVSSASQQSVAIAGPSSKTQTGQSDGSAITPFNPSFLPAGTTAPIYPSLVSQDSNQPTYPNLLPPESELELHLPSAPLDDEIASQSGFQTPTESAVGSTSQNNSTEENSGSSLSSIQGEIDLNKTLEAVDISPARPSDKSKKNVLVDKYDRIKEKAKAKILKFSKGEVDPSPELSKKRQCLFCKTLLNELAEKFKRRKNKVDKYKILTSIPKRFSIGEVMEATNCTKHEAEQASKLKHEKGAFSFLAARAGVRSLPQSTIDLVVQFYNDPTNSRVSARSGDCVKMRNDQGTKDDVGKLRILHNLNDLYFDFVNKNPQAKISISKFALLRPKNCVWPGHSHYHNVCVCDIHQNFQFMLDALGEERKLEDLVKTLTCGNDECYLGLCAECPKSDEVEKILGDLEQEDEITYLQWVRTDYTDIKTLTVSTIEFAELFRQYVPKIIEHEYITHQQNSFISKLKNNTIKEEAAIAITVDFAQNYNFVVQNSVQGFHWTNQQATVHPFVVHYWDLEKNELRYRTYCVISDILTHDASTFHLFRTEVLTLVKADFKDVAIGKVYYISDGAGSQYKNTKNMANLMEHVNDYDLAAEWVFTSTGHGKSTCDAISAVCKCHTRRASLKGAYITTAQAMFNHCLEKLTSTTLRFVKVTKEDFTIELQNKLEARYKEYEKLTGIRKHHLFQPRGDKIRMCRTANTNCYVDFDFRIPEVTTFTDENVEIGKFYAFYEGNNYQVGMLVDKDITEGDVVFQAMKINRRQNVLSMPDPMLLINIPYRQILCPIQDLVVDIRYPLGDKFSFKDENDLNMVKKTCKLYRQKKI